jgi:hypothetical protein
MLLREQLDIRMDVSGVSTKKEVKLALGLIKRNAMKTYGGVKV